MKSLSVLFFAFLLLNPLIAQKVKYKKGKISVDKVEQFEFEKITTKTGRLNNFKLKDMEGKEWLFVGDTTFVYKRLPNETEPRRVGTYYTLYAPQIDKEVVLPIGGLNMRKFITKKLNKAGFFKEGTITERILNNVVNQVGGPEKITQEQAAVAEIDLVREENYRGMEQEYGALTERKPVDLNVTMTSITEGRKKIGTIKVNEKGSYATSYKIINAEGYAIAGYTVIPSENKGNVRTFHNNERKTFRYREGTMNLQQKLTQAVQHLILHGYL